MTMWHCGDEKVMGTTLNADVDQVCNLIADKIAGKPRILIGIAGPPASGKSTLAEAVVRRLNAEHDRDVPHSALLAMDGYHLDNRLLKARGLLARKGAPQTFNAHGFCQAVHQLAKPGEEAFFPTFDRERDLAIANAVAISPETPVVVVEGNYLLLNTDPWRSLRAAFAVSVFVRPSIDMLRERLVQRWLTHGLDAQAALARATQNDLPNAKTVIEQSQEADLMLDQGR